MNKQTRKFKNRIEKHQIKPSHPAWKIIDELCFKSKSFYNYANFIIRKEMKENQKYKNYNTMAGELRTHDIYKDFGSQVAQQILRVIDRNWKSFFVAHDDWLNHPSKYLGEPKWPGYRDRDGRFPLILSNIQFRIENEHVYFSWKQLNHLNGIFKTNVNTKLSELRFIPHRNYYTMEIVYQIEVCDQPKESRRIAGIDLGINNLVTMANTIGVKPIVVNGRGIKSMNQYYNKKRAKWMGDLEKQSDKHWSNRLQRLTDKYINKVDYFMHVVSKFIIKWCVNYNIDTIVIGHNLEWKQNARLNKKVNQTFVQIPYNKLIHQITYKAENAGIKVIEWDESYTSGTSFLDGEFPCKENYDKSRRFQRGLFRSFDGTIINADLNGAYQIIRKIFVNAFSGENTGWDLHPVRIGL